MSSHSNLSEAGNPLKKENSIKVIKKQNSGNTINLISLEEK